MPIPMFEIGFQRLKFIKLCLNTNCVLLFKKNHWWRLTEPTHVPILLMSDYQRLHRPAFAGVSELSQSCGWGWLPLLPWLLIKTKCILAVLWITIGGACPLDGLTVAALLPLPSIAVGAGTRMAGLSCRRPVDWDGPLSGHHHHLWDL